MVQIVNGRALDARGSVNTMLVVRVATVARGPLETMFDRIARSTKLTLAEKRSFAEAIEAAFKAGDYKQVARIMVMIAQLEAEREHEVHAAHTVDEIRPKKAEGFATDAEAGSSDIAQVVSGAERLQQLLTV